MYARVMTFSEAKDFEGGVAFVRDKAVPILKEQKGYLGITASGDRSGALFFLMSLWETESDRAASQSALTPTREEGLAIIGGELTIENFEQVAAEVSTRPSPGSALMVTRTRQDPGSIDDNVAHFKSDVVPRIMSNRGFLAVRSLINRETGDGVVATAWADQESMTAAAAGAEERRSEAVARGVSFHGTTYREVLFADMP